MLQQQNPQLRWGTGLRAGLYAFWCSNEQTQAEMEIFTPLTASRDAFAVALARAMSRTPDGGTCPGRTLENVYSTLAMTNPRPYPWSIVVTFTDGVFYDMPRPQRAYEALRGELCAFTYAMAVAYAQVGSGDHPGSTGFTPKQLQLQRQQLTIATGVDLDGKSRLYLVTYAGQTNFNPYQALYDMATSATRQIAHEVAEAMGGAAPKECVQRPTWCGFGDASTCTNAFNSRFCKFTTATARTPKRACAPVGVCGMYNGAAATMSVVREECNADRFCRMSGNACVTNAAALPPDPPPDMSAACANATPIGPGACNGVVVPSSGGGAAAARACYWFDDDVQAVCKSFGVSSS